MKKWFVFILVTCSALIKLCGQYTDSTKAVISLEAIKVLYIGLDYPIRVAVPNTSPNSIKISAENCKITKREAGFFSIMPMRGRETTLYITTETDDTIKVLDSAKYTIKRVSYPELRLGRLSSGDYFYPPYRKGLLDSVSVTLGNGFVFEGFGYEVTEFSIIIAPPKNSPDSVFHTLIKGNKIPSRVEHRFKNMKPGYRIILDSVKARGPEGIRSLAPMIVEMRARTY